MWQVIQVSHSSRKKDKIDKMRPSFSDSLKKPTFDFSYSRSFQKTYSLSKIFQSIQIPGPWKRTAAKAIDENNTRSILRLTHLPWFAALSTHWFCDVDTWQKVEMNIAQIAIGYGNYPSSKHQLDSCTPFSCLERLLHVSAASGWHKPVFHLPCAQLSYRLERGRQIAEELETKKQPK